MKKLLALALCAVLLLGAIPFAGAAQFTDAAGIRQTTSEAVEILSDLKIITGFPEGTFKPDDTLTRAQAAKILCCCVLGTEESEKLAAGGTTFYDVPASHWANKYVEYCASKNIVAGVGGGKFNPDGKLTGYAFGKMLLVALGADAAAYTGAEWDKAVASGLRETKLGLGLTANGSELSRQDACRLALNALFNGEKDGADKTLAYKVFGVKRAAGEPDAAQYMRPRTVYTAKADAYWPGAELTLYASPACVHESGSFSGDAFVRAFGVTDIEKAKITVYYNGVLWNADSSNVKDIWHQGESGVHYLSGNGVRLELHYDAVKDTYTVVQIFTFNGKVTDVTEPVRGADGTVQTHGSVTFENGLSCVSDAFTKADIGSYALYRGVGDKNVLYYRVPVAVKIVEAWPGKVLTGTLTDRALRQSATIDGKLYRYPYLYISSFITADSYLEEGGALGDTVHYLLDEYDTLYAIWQ